MQAFILGTVMAFLPIVILGGMAYVMFFAAIMAATAGNKDRTLARYSLAKECCSLRSSSAKVLEVLDLSALHEWQGN